MTYSFKPITVVLILAALTACSSPAPEPAQPAAKPAASSPPPSPSHARLSVADLMAKAGCKGEVIGTQLYSYETGRCMLAGGEATIAVFDTAQLRDEWVKAGQGLGGTIVAGDGWAAWLEKGTGADQLATALGGARV